jgi:hypothetical protein
MSVVQVTTAELFVILVAATLLITWPVAEPPAAAQMIASTDATRARDFNQFAARVPITA